jgi:ketosteroid isomerase-like protein
MIETDKNVATIRELERQRCEALVARDFDVFAAVAHPKLTWTHTNGATDTLDSYLRKCRDGLYVYNRIDYQISSILVHGDVALVYADVDADVAAGGNRRPLSIVSLAVWVRDDENWTLLAYQTTPRHA